MEKVDSVVVGCFKMKTATTGQDVIATVEAYYKLEPGKLKKYCRTRTVARARKLAMYLCREYVGLSWEEVAQLFNRHPHTAKRVLKNRVIDQRGKYTIIKELHLGRER